MSIEVKNLNFSYGSTEILRDISLNFEQSRLTTILGPNGCGKSTLFHIICRALPLQAGEILLQGKPISNYTRQEQARSLAVLSQSGSLPEFMTVHDMVMQGRFCYQSFLSRYSDEDLQIVEEAMEVMDVKQLAHKRVSQVSGGQLQRCRMAMTLAQQTDVVLLDEPTTHLDLKHQYALLDMGKQLAHAGKTVIAILHDMTQALLYSDAVVILHDKQVYAVGEPHQVMTDAMMVDVFGIQTKRIGNQKVGLHVPIHLLD